MKSIKKFLIGLLAVLSLIIMPNLVACGNMSENENPDNVPENIEAPANREFYSFSKYKNFYDGVVAIEVKWDIHGSFGEFTIDDSEQVNHLTNLYNNTTLKNIGKEPPAGDNGYIEFVYGDGKKISAGLFIIYDSETGHYYSYPDRTIHDYIKQVGIDKKVIV